MASKSYIPVLVGISIASANLHKLGNSSVRYGGVSINTKSKSKFLIFLISFLLKIGISEFARDL